MPSPVALITYADRLGGSFAGLTDLLDTELAGLFGAVHVLPFFQPYDGADAGFDPVDHTRVDPRLGDWADVRALADRCDVTVDLIVNHISADSPDFRQWRARGAAAPSDGMFLTFGAVFPDGATEDALLRLYRPRPGLPFTAYPVGDGRRLLWTTFTPQQIDLDTAHPAARAYLLGVLDTLAAAGVRQVRLDAVGYAVKTAGTSSFMTARTFEFIDEVTGWCHERGLSVLVEIHSYYRRQVEIAGRVDQVYDFALPPLALHALTTGDLEPLRRWVAIRPTNTVTVLDTHDGIGVVDVGPDPDDPANPGLLTPGQIDALVTRIHTNSGGTSRAATGAAAANLDLYQVNCTVYDALGRDDARYLLARAVQLWLPGVPQIYYVGLLAGSNDMALLARTGTGRDVNRHHYERAEVAAELTRPVVAALLSLIRLRGGHPAFDGQFRFGGTGSRLTATWTAGDELAELAADVATGEATVSWTQGGRTRRERLTELR